MRNVDRSHYASWEERPSACSANPQDPDLNRYEQGFRHRARQSHAGALARGPGYDCRSAASGTGADDLINELNELVWKSDGDLLAHPKWYQIGIDRLGASTEAARFLPFLQFDHFQHGFFRRLVALEIQASG